MKSIRRIFVFIEVFTKNLICFKYIQSCWTPFKDIGTYSATLSGIFRHVQPEFLSEHSDKFHHILVYSYKSQHIQGQTNTFQHIQAHPLSSFRSLLVIILSHIVNYSSFDNQSCTTHGHVGYFLFLIFRFCLLTSRVCSVLIFNFWSFVFVGLLIFFRANKFCVYQYDANWISTLWKNFKFKYNHLNFHI